MTSEYHLEQRALTWFQDTDREYHHGPDIVPDGETLERHSLLGATMKAGGSGE